MRKAQTHRAKRTAIHKWRSLTCMNLPIRQSGRFSQILPDFIALTEFHESRAVLALYL